MECWIAASLDWDMEVPERARRVDKVTRDVVGFRFAVA